MEIKVTRSVPYDKGYETRCMYNDGDFWGHSVCAHHVYRDRTHGRQAPVERRLPKYALFGVWLDGEYEKCDACLEACKEALGKPMQKPLTLEEMVIYADPVWLEFRLPGGHGWYLGIGLATRAAERWYRHYQLSTCVYGKDYRFWRQRPTDEEREAAAWEN